VGLMIFLTYINYLDMRDMEFGWWRSEGGGDGREPVAGAAFGDGEGVWRTALDRWRKSTNAPGPPAGEPSERATG